MTTHLNTIAAIGTAEFKDRGSKFVGCAIPVESAEAFKIVLKDFKKEHPKANHHCFAFRIGLDGNNFRVSDDGEPSGSAGRPILGQMDSKEVTNATIIVARYFGGTLLGVPGLINAYKTVSALSLQVIPIIQKPVMKQYVLEFDYSALNDAMQVIKQCGGQVIAQNQGLFQEMTIQIPVINVSLFLSRISDIRRVVVK